MNSSLRKQVLSVYKKLHRTRKIVFQGDDHALVAARSKIQEEFGTNKSLTDLKAIEEQINYAAEVEEVLRKTVVQAVRTENGNYRAVIREDVEMLDTSAPYTPMPDSMIGPFKRKRSCAEDKKS